MGKLLEQIFQIVEEKGGVTGRLKLAQMTHVTQQQAADMKDKSIMVKRFKKAAAEILQADIDEWLK